MTVLVTLLVITLAGVFMLLARVMEEKESLRKKLKESQENLKKSNHIKKLVKESFDASEKENKVLRLGNKELSRILQMTHNGVYYDEVNDTVVTYDNLRRLGDLE